MVTLEDEDGELVYPMVGFELRTVADRLLVLIIEYIESDEHVESGERKTFKTMLPPDKAGALAEVLSKASAVLARSQSAPNDIVH